MQIVAECATDHSFAGAAIVAVVFLVVFVVLIFGDGVLTALALIRTFTRINNQDREIANLKAQIEELNAKHPITLGLPLAHSSFASCHKR